MQIGEWDEVMPVISDGQVMPLVREMRRKFHAWAQRRGIRDEELDYVAVGKAGYTTRRNLRNRKQQDHEHRTQN